MPLYIVTGFHKGAFRTVETTQQTVNEAIAYAESLGVEPEVIKCPKRREVFRKEGKSWTVDRYMPEVKVTDPKRDNIVYLVSFFVPIVGLGVGGFRSIFGLANPIGPLVAGGLGLVAWGVGYAVVTSVM